MIIFSSESKGVDSMLEQLIQKFQELYGDGGELRTYFAPGRVNLIGEHTDYNGGHVFPCALTLGTYAAVRNREDNKLRFYSMNFAKPGVIESDLNDLVPRPEASWTNYPKGVMWAFAQRGLSLTHGLDIAICGDIPNGSGLSSSASLEVLTGLILKDTFGFDELTMQDLALIGQYSENNFNGMNCGIMDQFASAMGKQGCAIFLDTNTLEYEYAPVCLEDAKIVITNSNVKHSLVTSAYNDRRRECETALKELQTMLLKLGYDLGPCGIDGDFGKATEAAVRSFQSDHRLAADGICGAKTWAELEKSVNVISVKPKEVTYCVTIGGLDLTQAQALIRNYPGSVLKED